MACRDTAHARDKGIGGSFLRYAICSKSLAAVHLDEQSLAIGQRVASRVDNPRLAPMFAALAADQRPSREWALQSVRDEGS